MYQTVQTLFFLQEGLVDETRLVAECFCEATRVLGMYIIMHAQRGEDLTFNQTSACIIIIISITRPIFFEQQDTSILSSYKSNPSGLNNKINL